ncbi:MAG: DUF4931 domain-containing protein [Candidatus Colwellbacteria bacterium]|nr:DUF4931 domain-containing protein [Candidatus Colwellbacteria bacterium]
MSINNELRQDLVSGDWILFSPKRGRRPNEFKEKKKRARASIVNCVFERPRKASGGNPILISPLGDDWRVQLVPNRYPALTHNGLRHKIYKRGPYAVVPGTGHHDLVITKNHDDNFSKLSEDDANLLFRVFRDRYLMLLDDDDIRYVSIFHNWGPKAGASIYHPHYQVIALPVVPPDVEHSLSGSKKYFRNNRICVHCLQIKWEKQQKKRVIFENSCAIAFAPFVSRSEFEIRLFPKKHLPFFEDTSEVELGCMVHALQKVLRLLEKSLKDPDYNFFIHTAPVKNKQEFRHYHWHVEIQPKITLAAGFELGTGMEINVVDPDEAARIIKGND